MKTTKKIAMVILALMLIASCFAFGVGAEEIFTDGYYTYTVTDGEAILTGITENLKGDIVIPSKLGGYPVVEIGVGAFAGNETVTSAVIPDGVRKIGNGAFEKCKTSLKKVVMPDTVTELGAGAFMECHVLEEVVLSKNIKVIDMYTFEMCYSLKKLNLPEGLEIVGGISMTACASLEELIFPDSVEIIQGYTLLNNAISLKKIVIGKNAKSIDDHNGGFSELYSLEDVYVYSPDYDFTGSLLGYVSMGPILEKISKEEWIALYYNFATNSNNLDMEKLMDTTEAYQGGKVLEDLTIHAVHDSKAEIYAKENGIKFEYIHDFGDGKWTYDYENMIRYRDCVYPGCDGSEIEDLIKTETDNGEAIAPDQEGDFGIVEIIGDDFIVIEEHIKESVSGEVDVEVLKGFDITLKDSEGVHIQPDGTVKVKLPIEWSKNGVYKVYHVDENGVLTDMNAYREGSHLVFDTDHFSIYVIVVENEKTSEEETKEPSIPEEPDTGDCSCICHKSGIIGFIWKIVQFFSKLLKINPICECGLAHY